MRICRLYRIPHSEFLSWSDDDQDKALSYEQHLVEQAAEQCPACHTHRDEWIDPETGRVLTEPAWEVAVVECEGCRRLADRRKDLGKSGDADGRTVVLRPAGTAASKVAAREARTVGP